MVDDAKSGKKKVSFWYRNYPYNCAVVREIIFHICGKRDKYIWSQNKENVIMQTVKNIRPPAVIRIPKNAKINDDLVYFGDMVVGLIDPLTPKGMMNIVSPMTLIMEDNDGTL